MGTGYTRAQVSNAFRGGLLSSFQSALIAAAVDGVPTIVASRAVRGRQFTFAGAAKGTRTLSLESFASTPRTDALCGRVTLGRHLAVPCSAPFWQRTPAAEHRR